jgi:beta-fructofuranosidase
MWECPDYFELTDTGEFANKAIVKVLSVSPQGLHGGDWDRRNVYQSGYFVLLGDVTQTCTLLPFALWDAGFDFYAPQTFQADDGRRILIGWMGMPDEKTYTNLTVRDGWQHCFTIPREVTAKYGRVLQWPVHELEDFRTNLREQEGTLEAEDTKTFDLLIDEIDFDQPLTVTLAGQMQLTWRERRFEMRFFDENMESTGAGRKSRFEFLDELHNVRVVGDMSSVEVFVNDGELTFSSRYYPEHYSLSVEAPTAQVHLWDLEVKA